MSDLLVVSHRWERPEAPDSTGVQLRALQAHLAKHPEVYGVWFDYSCMPQGARTPAQDVRFGHMLRNVNLLYLGLPVLLLVDISYLSRFWTQFECWLSMRECRSSGLEAAHPSRRRYTIECLHNATAGFADAKLRQMWERVTPDEAHALLSKPDVTVTNQRDKDTQLIKVAALDDEVRAALGADGAAALRASGVTAEAAPLGFGFDALRGGGFTSDELAARALARLAHRDDDVRREAAERMLAMDAAERDAAIGRLGTSMLRTPLGRLPLAAHYAQGALRALRDLEGSDAEVRKAAVEALGESSPEVLATHAAAIVARLEDAVWWVRKAAIETLGKLEPFALALLLVDHTSLTAVDAECVVAQLPGSRWRRSGNWPDGGGKTHAVDAKLCWDNRYGIRCTLTHVASLVAGTDGSFVTAATFESGRLSSLEWRGGKDRLVWSREDVE